MVKTLTYTDAVLNYVADTGVREHAVLKTCRDETMAMGGISRMQISPEQGAFMGITAQLMNAKRYIEVGTFTGYSALAVALALPDDGHVDALDISEEYMAKARGYWAKAGQARKITGHVRPAVETLDKFLAEGQAGRYDFAFIDADKSSYDAYYERMLKLVRPGGLVAIDNVLWSGKVVDASDTSDDTVAIRKLNAKIKADGRVDTVLLPVADGIFMCRKR
ncbi:MAG: class I SAM-dependent methyltransferase [Alphaproteobacteria bacterium]|jgi:predicted O-methyltransferase YrrM|nr:class I SAM-dependent methyltransferase [Alphaproteobacteria bacterium]